MQVISQQALASYMAHRGYSVRTLALAVEREVQRKHPDITVRHAQIGHLRNPRSNRRTCRPEVARAIEDVLGAPRDSLFTPRLSSVQRETQQGAA